MSVKSIKVHGELSQQNYNVETRTAALTWLYHVSNAFTNLSSNMWPIKGRQEEKTTCFTAVKCPEQ